MRILILTQYYPPEIGAPQRRLSSLARRLAELGHAVRVLTAMPNYPEGIVRESHRGRFLSEEALDRVPVSRSWMWATSERSVLLRILSYLSFALSALLAGALDRRPTDVVLTESPPLFLGITGLLLARLKRADFVLNVADLWPRAAVEMGVVTSPVLIAAAQWLERRLYRSALVVTTQTEGMRRHIAGTTGNDRVVLFENGVDLETFRPDLADPRRLEALELNGSFLVGYAGLHGYCQNLDVVVEAARKLSAEDRIIFALFGHGPEKDRLQKQARDVTSVRFLPAQPAEAMPPLVAAWGAGVVALRDLPSLESARPSKMFEVMGAGVPLVLAARGESARLVREADCGIAVDPGDARGLAEAVSRLRDDPALRRRLGANGRRLAEERFDRARIAERIAAAIEQARSHVRKAA